MNAAIAPSVTGTESNKPTPYAMARRLDIPQRKTIPDTANMITSHTGMARNHTSNRKSSGIAQRTPTTTPTRTAANHVRHVRSGPRSPYASCPRRSTVSAPPDSARSTVHESPDDGDRHRQRYQETHTEGEGPRTVDADQKAHERPDENEQPQHRPDNQIHVGEKEQQNGTSDPDRNTDDAGCSPRSPRTDSRTVLRRPVRRHHRMVSRRHRRRPMPEGLARLPCTRFTWKLLIPSPWADAARFVTLEHHDGRSATDSHGGGAWDNRSADLLAHVPTVRAARLVRRCVRRRSRRAVSGSDCRVLRAA